MNETLELEHVKKTASNPNYSPPILFSPDEVITDYINFFSGARNDNMFKYAYLPDNDYYDQVISKCEGYYLCRDETDTIKNNLDKFAQHLEHDINIYEIGPGSEKAFLNKMLPIINCIKNPLGYYAIDISAEFAQHAVELALRYYPRFKTGTIVKNFADLSFSDFTLTDNQKVLFCLGSTLGNFNDQFVDVFISLISSILTTNDKFIFSVDSNQDSATLMQAYDNQYTNNFCKNILRYADDKFSDIDWERGFRFAPAWNNKVSSVELLFRVEHDQVINIQGYEIFIKKGAILYAGKARKFSDSDIKGMLTKNDLVVVERLNYAGRMNTYICKKI